MKFVGRDILHLFEWNFEIHDGKLKYFQKRPTKNLVGINALYQRIKKHGSDLMPLEAVTHGFNLMSFTNILRGMVLSGSLLYMIRHFNSAWKTKIEQVQRNAIKMFKEHKRKEHVKGYELLIDFDITEVCRDGNVVPKLELRRYWEYF